MQAHPRFLATSLATLIVVLAFTAGCGHSGQAGSTASGGSSQATGRAKSTPAANKAAVAEFRAGADAICEALNSELETSKPSSTSIAELLRFTPVHSAMEHKSLKKLEALQAPPSLAATWQQMIGVRKELLRQLDELARDAKSNNQPRIKQLAGSKLQLHTALQTLGAQLDSAACSKLG